MCCGVVQIGFLKPVSLTANHYNFATYKLFLPECLDLAKLFNEGMEGSGSE